MPGHQAQLLWASKLASAMQPALLGRNLPWQPHRSKEEVSARVQKQTPHPKAFPTPKHTEASPSWDSNSHAYTVTAAATVGGWGGGSLPLSSQGPTAAQQPGGLQTKAHGASSPSAHPCHFTSPSLSQPPTSAADTISPHISASTTPSSCTGKLLLILQNPTHTRSWHQLPWNHIKPVPSAAV